MRYKNISATKLSRITIPLLAVLLIVGPTPAQAGILDTILNKVNNIQNRVGTLLSNTSGLQDFMTTMRDIRDSLGDGAISNVRENLGEAQDLIQFIKDRREMAGDKSQYPDLGVLIASLENVASVLRRNPGQGSALETLSALINVLPDKAMAPVARVVSRAGVDADFVANVNQMSVELADMIDILNASDAQPQQVFSVSLGAGAFGQNAAAAPAIPVVNTCRVNDPQKLERLSNAAIFLSSFAQTLKLSGSFIDATSGALNTQKEVAIWGWVGLSVETDVAATFGKVLVVVADATLLIVNKANKVLDGCEAQARLDVILALNEQLLNSGLEILDSNENLKMEICALTRYRSESCRALRP